MSAYKPHIEEDAYLTLSKPSEAEIKVLGSKFLGYAYPIAEETAFQARLEALKKKYYDATHHCFAYRLGFEGEEFRYSDDGEPSGTAGKRILGSIDREHLTHIGIVVVRYFGGTKLGVGGLARAYSESADAAIAAGSVVKRYIKKRYRIRFPYDATKTVHHDIDTYDVEILDRSYSDDVLYDIRLRISRVERFQHDLLEHTQRNVQFIESVHTDE